MRKSEESILQGSRDGAVLTLRLLSLPLPEHLHARQGVAERTGPGPAQAVECVEHHARHQDSVHTLFPVGASSSLEYALNSFVVVSEAVLLQCRSRTGCLLVRFVHVAERDQRRPDEAVFLAHLDHDLRPQLAVERVCDGQRGLYAVVMQGALCGFVEVGEWRGRPGDGVDNDMLLVAWPRLWCVRAGATCFHASVALRAVLVALDVSGFTGLATSG